MKFQKSYSHRDAKKRCKTKLEDIGKFLRAKNIFKVKAVRDNDKASDMTAIYLIKRFYADFKADAAAVEDEPPDDEHEMDNRIRNSGTHPGEYCGVWEERTFQLGSYPGTYIRPYEDFTVHLRDEPTRTNIWTIEHITRENVDHYEHRHFEMLHPWYGHEVPNDKSVFNVANIWDLVNRFICRRCECSSFPNVFHQYVKFLTELYPVVYICSGMLYIPKPNKDGTIPKDMPGPTKMMSHFFKIIVCKNKDKTFRFECYKVAPECVHKKIIDLKNYLVLREDLNADAGVNLIPRIAVNKVKETVTHPDFRGTKADPRAHRFKHICMKCAPFQSTAFPPA
uniref:Uncharacterized protein n=1 Tax=Strigamia maritima TaxID=126957 RepID=T1IR70_STRMM